MKRILALVVLTLLLALPLLPACKSGDTGEHTKVQINEILQSLTGQEAADDIMPVPGGGPA